jgi:hypothetical protein
MRKIQVIAAELSAAEKNLGACVELLALYPNREELVKRVTAQRVKLSADVQRLANELEDAEIFSREPREEGLV